MLPSNHSLCKEGAPVPLYDYRCPGCGTQREILQKMSDTSVPNCVACAPGPAMVKQVTAPLAPRFRAARGGSSSGGSRRVDTSQLPYVGRDGSLHSASGKKLLTPSGQKA